MHLILFDNLLDEVPKRVVLVALTPRELVKVGLEQLARCAKPLFVSMLALLPHAFDVVGARAGVWVHKVFLVVHPDVIVAQLVEIGVRCLAVSYN